MRGVVAAPALALGAVFGAALLAGCTVGTDGHAVAADHDGPRTVRASALPDTLLDAARINDIVESTDLKVQHTITTMDQSTAQLSNPDCVAAFLPAEKEAYDGSGWLALNGRALRGDGGNGTSAIETVVAFGTRSAAQDFYTTMTGQWQRCADQPLDVDYRDGSSSSWRFGPVTDHDGTLSMVQDAVGSTEHWACQRALRVSNNVAIDTMVCKSYVNDEAVAVADGIDARLPSV